MTATEMASGNTLQHCEDILADTPDDWALARLFLPRESRNAATALLALRAELRRVPFSSEEPGIVHMKLQWWRDEIERAANGETQHPVLLAMIEFGFPAGMESDYLLELVDAAAMEFDADAIRNEADRQLYLYRSSGVVAELFARLATGMDRSQSRIARDIGLACGQLDVLQRLAHDLPRSCFRIPLDALAAHEIAPAAIAQAPTQRRTALLKGERDVLDRLRIAARTRMAETEPVAALRVLWRRLEEDYRRLPDDLASLAVTAPQQPGMLRRLWSAWRAARKTVKRTAKSNGQD